MNVEAEQQAVLPGLRCTITRIHTALPTPCPQGVYLSGSCQCFLFPLFALAHISSQQPLYLLQMSFCWCFFVLSLFCLSFPNCACPSRQYSELIVYTGIPAERLRGWWLWCKDDFCQMLKDGSVDGALTKKNKKTGGVDLSHCVRIELNCWKSYSLCEFHSSPPTLQHEHTHTWLYCCTCEDPCWHNVPSQT